MAGTVVAAILAHQAKLHEAREALNLAAGKVWFLVGEGDELAKTTTDALLRPLPGTAPPPAAAMGPRPQPPPRQLPVPYKVPSDTGLKKPKLKAPLKRTVANYNEKRHRFVRNRCRICRKRSIYTRGRCVDCDWRSWCSIMDGKTVDCNQCRTTLMRPYCRRHCDELGKHVARACPRCSVRDAGDDSSSSSRDTDADNDGSFSLDDNDDTSSTSSSTDIVRLGKWKLCLPHKRLLTE